MKRITTITLLVAAMLSASAVYAAPVTWRLKDIVFADGSTACGSYVYDTATNTYSDFRIYVSGSGTRYGYTPSCTGLANARTCRQPRCAYAINKGP